MPTFLRYLRQPSTWRGVSIVAGTAAAIVGAPVVTVGSVVAGIIGAIEVIRDEHKNPPPPPPAA